MRNIVLSIIIISAFLFLVGCTSIGMFPQSGQTKTELSQKNYQVIKPNARGVDSGFFLFGIIPFNTPTFADAVGALQEGVPMKGRATALANVTQDISFGYYILFSIPKITISADVVEFTQ